MEDYSQQIQNFDIIGLAALGEKKLMDRIDQKFIIPEDKLLELLNAQQSNYSCLVINDKKIFEYCSIYYDTINCMSYHDTRQRKPNRFKLRYRDYVDSQIKYFEIKKKIKGMRTTKIRIPVNEEKIGSSEILTFLQKNGIPTHTFLEQVCVKYNRLSLISKTDNERITIDTNIKVSDGIHEFSLGPKAIIEVKQDKLNKESLFLKTLSNLGYKAKSFSKYCIAMALTNNELSKIGLKQSLSLLQN